MNFRVQLLFVCCAWLTSATVVKVSNHTSHGAPLTYIQRNQQVTIPATIGPGLPLPQIVYNSYVTNLYFGLPPPTPKKEQCDAVPECAAENGFQSYCLTDSWYPEAEIKAAIENDQLVQKKVADVANQSTLALSEGLERTEDTFDYSLYNGNRYDKGNWLSATEGFVCPSNVVYGRPMRAINAMGQWRVIVQNVYNVTQTQRIETCLVNGGSCRTVDPCHQSKCLQKFAFQRFLSYDPCDARRGLFIDIFKFPSACSCHVGK